MVAPGCSPWTIFRSKQPELKHGSPGFPLAQMTGMLSRLK